jgi:hypothetical protein
MRTAECGIVLNRNVLDYSIENCTEQDGRSQAKTVAAKITG